MIVRTEIRPFRFLLAAAGESTARDRLLLLLGMDQAPSRQENCRLSITGTAKTVPGRAERKHLFATPGTVTPRPLRSFPYFFYQRDLTTCTKTNQNTNHS
jgi:hypothetical protein